ncbi:metal ABC transporter permease [Paenibacillus urinalis]|uniref:Manganese transport system membrane protein MntC n=1 Tax=Paenibacillus urinalis TaxID=521520 RepID=A0AAX3MWG9_9BACL|nr:MULTISPECIES: metal ABC transporter permease [Paenibacillus]WDH81955.1 metal ABC transporter permease [Paenibacillus urinalis]WDH98002.1 metal ABC transporter permease [Paenibacillus urinalis]WDI01683.1 metal ABC transporter permease [Paenibacillus urinalis]GAK42515.1 Mn2+/Zn3+ ABC transporter permease protein [Paenibacillus sp. TCA20]
MFEWIASVVTDPNVRWILFGSMLLGFSSGLIGSFTYLRKQSLIGDTLAHAALPGICIAFMLSGVKSTFLFMIGALVAGWMATIGISLITRYSRIKQDTALGIVLSVFFGIGIVLLTKIQHGDYGSASGLDKYMFGQAASMVRSDVYMMLGVSVLLLIVCWLLFKEFKLISFDAGFARGMGYPSAFLEQLLLFLTVIAVVAGVQVVGVVLVAALLITPAAAARYWTNALGLMVCLAGLFGAISGALGTLISATTPDLPTGPVTVLVITLIFGVSVLIAPGRGLLAKEIRKYRTKTDYNNQQQSVNRAEVSK